MYRELAPRTSAAPRLRPACLALLAVGALGCSGCNLYFDDGGGPATPTPAPGNIVTVGLINSTEWAVEANLYVADQPLTNPAVDLFVPAYLTTNGVGLAASGLLPPVSADVLQLPCSADLTLGTSGGIFYDADSGDEQGTGIARVLTKGLVFDCGAVITFTFRAEGDGFTVDVTLE